MNHAPKRFVIENGKLVGMEFEQLEWTRRRTASRSSTVIDTSSSPCDDVILAIGQENAFPWIERDIGIEFDKWDMPVVDKVTMQSHARRRVLRRRRGVGPAEHHLGGGARPPGGDLHSPALPGTSGHRASAAGHEPREHEDGHARSGATATTTTRRRARRCSTPSWWSASRSSTSRWSSASRPSRRRAKSSAASTATSRRTSPTQLCIECDACVDVCPVELPHHHAERRAEVELRQRADRRRRCNLEQAALSCPSALPQTKRVMVKDEDICVHCGLCAERCPTAAWDMQKFDAVVPMPVRVAAKAGRVRRSDARQTHTADASINDFAFKMATVNGTGSASANSLLMQAIFRMGIPVIGQEPLPVEHPGTADLVRDPRQQGRLHRARARVRPGRRAEPGDLRAATSRGAAGRLPALRLDVAARRRRSCAKDITILGVPFGADVRRALRGRPRAHADEEHRVRRRARRAARHRHGRHRADARGEVREEEGAARRRTTTRSSSGYDYATRALRVPAAVPSREDGRHRATRILIDGNTAAALGCVYAGATVGAWYPITPSTSLMDAFKELLRALPHATRRPARTTTASCRRRTSSPRSAS